jgi:hypothetical protein
MSKLTATALVCVAAALVAPTFAADSKAAAPKATAKAVKYMVVNQAAPALMDNKAAEALVQEALPVAKLAKVYPASKWGFATTVEGGLTAAGVCAVTARVTLMPRTAAQQSLLMRPGARTSSAFDAQTGLSKEKCSELAGAKLKEATQSVVSGLVK